MTKVKALTQLRLKSSGSSNKVGLTATLKSLSPHNRPKSFLICFQTKKHRWSRCKTNRARIDTNKSMHISRDVALLWRAAPSESWSSKITHRLPKARYKRVSNMCLSHRTTPSAISIFRTITRRDKTLGCQDLTSKLRARMWLKVVYRVWKLPFDVVVIKIKLIYYGRRGSKRTQISARCGS